MSRLNFHEKLKKKKKNRILSATNFAWCFKDLNPSGHLVKGIGISEWMKTSGGWLANNEDPDHTAPLYSDLGLQCLFRHFCPNI